MTFIDILNSIGVRQHVSGPTHSRNHTLDLIRSHGIDVNGVEILQQSDDISDHYLVLCKLHIVKAVNSTPSYKYGRTITSTTKDCFVSNLPDLSQFLSISNSSEQLDVTETMNSLFSSTLDTLVPLRLRKIKEKSPTPWYNEHTRTLKRAAQKMERSWRKTKLEVFRLAWRESTLSYRKALKTARSDYFSSLLEQNKHNPRYLFNTVAKLTKNKASTGVDISQQHSSNDFMNYFTSKIDTIRDQIVTMQLSAISSHQILYYRSPEEQFHSFSTIGEEELYKLVKSSKPTTCMLDPIPSKLLKEVLPEVIDPLLAIINLSLSLGYVPKNFKLAVIKPLIKKPQLDPKVLVNYRPISNLPFLSKILEKIVSSQLYSFLEKNDICEDFQSGFRPYHSTETALIRVTNDLLLSSDRGCISLLVLLDLSAAFDAIDHNILLNRLENFVGISGSALAWFKSYLSDRHQFVAVNEEVSYRSQASFVNTLTEQATETITVRTFPNQKPWVDRSIRDAVNKRTAAYNEALLSGNMREYKASCYALRRAVSAAKHRYKERIESHFQLNDSRRMWQGLRTICAFGNKSSAEVRADPSLAEELNTFYGRFESNGGIVALPSSSSESSRQRSENHVITVTEDEVRRALKGVNIRKAAGPDGITGRVLRSCADQLAGLFTSIFNESLATSVVPTSFKKSIIIPVPKNSKPSCLNDYRPVALTSIVMKVFERLVKSHISTSIPVTLDPLQFAYRSNRSTDDAISHILHSSLTHIDSSNGNYARLLFIDYSSAFNTIVPTKLTNKLTGLGLNTSLCDWIQDFLTGRPQVVKVGQYNLKLHHPERRSPAGLRSESPALLSLHT